MSGKEERQAERSDVSDDFWAKTSINLAVKVGAGMKNTGQPRGEIESLNALATAKRLETAFGL